MTVHKVQCSEFDNVWLVLPEKALARISVIVVRERYFTGSASHELRTPITVITGALELLEQGDLSPEDQKAVDRIRRATLGIKFTVGMFLCIAREADDGQYDEEFPVGPLVRRALDQQRYLLTGKNVEVDVQILATATVRGHPQAFLIAATNPVRNAFEQTPAGQGPITVSIHTHELRVTNRSDGDDDCQPTLAGTSSSGGYGLGLGIVQRLGERNGWAFSIRANGARVTACLCW